MEVQLETIIPILTRKISRALNEGILNDVYAFLFLLIFFTKAYVVGIWHLLYQLSRKIDIFLISP